jgi:hypothetical protein
MTAMLFPRVMQIPLLRHVGVTNKIAMWKHSVDLLPVI